MNTCQTCAYWNKNKTPYGREEYIVRQCENEKLQEGVYRENQQDDVLYYIYEEGGRFYPGPNFGCVHHAERKRK